MTVKSENEKTESEIHAQGPGENDVWRIIQSRAPEPLPKSESSNQDSENVSLFPFFKYFTPLNFRV